MNAETAAVTQTDTSSTSGNGRDKSPAKALFCGQIVRSALWPFPAITAGAITSLGPLGEPGGLDGGGIPWYHALD